MKTGLSISCLIFKDFLTLKTRVHVEFFKRRTLNSHNRFDNDSIIRQSVFVVPSLQGIHFEPYFKPSTFLFLEALYQYQSSQPTFYLFVSYLCLYFTIFIFSIQFNFHIKICLQNFSYIPFSVSIKLNFQFCFQ